MNWENVSKLAFIYINSSLLDLSDKKDYLEEGYEEEWNEISVVADVSTVI